MTWAFAPVELLTGALELEIEALAPIHVGCGSFELHDGRIAKEPVRRRGILVIPGASIKGAIRQIFEALTASGSPFDGREHHRAEDGKGREKPPPLSAAASLFGTLGLQGRVSFDDAVAGEGDQPIEVQPEVISLSVAYQPQKAVGRRFYGRLPADARQPPTIPALAIPEGAKLSTALRFRNASQRELGRLLASLGIDRFTPRLGGGKYDDFGWVRFCAVALRLRPRGFRGGGTWEHEGEAVASFVRTCLDQMDLPASGKTALAELTAKLQAPARPSAEEARS